MTKNQKYTYTVLRLEGLKRNYFKLKCKKYKISVKYVQDEVVNENTCFHYIFCKEVRIVKICYVK